MPDFPQPGITFRDITPLLADPAGFRAVLDGLVAPLRDLRIDCVVGIEARGFIFAAPLADRLGAGFVPIRKAGKLPWEVRQEAYALEYGTDLLELHVDGVGPGQRVALVDDVLATGGTAAAAIRLVEASGAEVVACSFLIELSFLDGRKRLDGREVHSLLKF